MNTKLRDKLIKNSKSEYTDSLDESKFFNNRDEILTMVPMLNVGLSGHLDGGLKAGVTMFAGPSKHFKTGLALICAEAFLKKYPDAIMLFYDSEAGAPKSYFETMNVDTSRVIHTVIKNIEELKFDIVSQLEGLSREDKVVIVIDSIGNLASKKEIEDAINEKSVADMTRAKALKSLFRIVTPYLNILDIPMLVINHTYKEIGLFPKDIVGGGTGAYYAANTIFIIGRQQEKSTKGEKELLGYNFILKAEKSRFLKEKSAISLYMSFENGIDIYSGLLEEAEEAGFIVKNKGPLYIKKGDKEVYEPDETKTPEFWEDILGNDEFKMFIRNKYSLVGELVEDDEV